MAWCGGLLAATVLILIATVLDGWHKKTAKALLSLFKTRIKCVWLSANEVCCSRHTATHHHRPAANQSANQNKLLQRHPLIFLSFLPLSIHRKAKERIIRQPSSQASIWRTAVLIGWKTNDFFLIRRRRLEQRLPPSFVMQQIGPAVRTSSIRHHSLITHNTRILIRIIIITLPTRPPSKCHRLQWHRVSPTPSRR